MQMAKHEQLLRDPGPQPRSQPHAGLLIGSVWLAITLVTLVIGFRQAIFIAPTEATMGNVQRIFYWHVPSAILGLLFPYVNFAASLAYLFLRRRDPFKALMADAIAVASAEVTVIFVSICLATGMLWGKRKLGASGGLGTHASPRCSSSGSFTSPTS